MVSGWIRFLKDSAMRLVRKCPKRGLFWLCLTSAFLLLCRFAVSPSAVIRNKFNGELPHITHRLFKPYWNGSQVESLPAGKSILPYDITSVFSLQDIRNFSVETVIRSSDEPVNMGCVVSFNANITLSTYLGQVTMTMQLQTLPVDPESESRQMEGNIKGFFLSVLNEIVFTVGPQFPKMLVLLLDPVNPQLNSDVRVDKLDHLFSCTKRGPQGHIPLFARTLDFTWYETLYHDVNIPENYTELSKLFRYLANCDRPIRDLFGNAPGAAPLNKESPENRSMSCFVPETKITLSSHSSNPQNIVLVPLKRDFLCNIPRSVMSILRRRADVTSLIMSIGSDLRSRVEHLSSVVTRGVETADSLYAEVDTRTSSLISEYDYHCWNATDRERLTVGSYRLYQDMPFKKMSYAREGRYIKAHLSNGMVAYLKYIGLTPARPRHPTYFNQGVAELVSHYVDTILGLSLTPLTVRRKVYMTPNCSTPDECRKLTYNYKTAKIGGKLGWDPNVEFSRNLFQQVKQDSTSGRYYIDFAVLGWVKNIVQRMNNGSFEPLTSDLDAIRRFFQHRVSLENITGVLTTRQDLKEISDILLFNFLVHDWDHSWIKNWARSGSRYLSFDNGLAFDPELPSSICEVLLHCPFLFCRLVGSKSTCTSTENDFKFCRFNTETILRLKRAGPRMRPERRLGVRVRELLKDEEWYDRDFEEYFGKDEVGTILDKRLVVILDHVKHCEETYGEKIFI